MPRPSFGADDGEQFRRLARSLRGAANTELRKEFNRAIQTAVRPIVKEVRVEARTTLPARGGLNKTIARSSIKTKKSTGRLAGITIIASKKRASDGQKIDLRRINAGTVRHPLFGNRHHWYPQRVPPGFWTRPTRRAARRSRRELKAAMNRIARRVRTQSR